MRPIRPPIAAAGAPLGEVAVAGRPGLHHREGREARDGRRVQPGAVRQGVQGPVQAGGARLRQGGAAGYGLRRLLINQSGSPKSELKPLEQKSLQTDRVVLVPGPTEERAVVRRIYRLFVHEKRRGESEIASELNHANVTTTAARGPAAPSDA